MKNFLFSACLLTAPFSAFANTSYECQSSKGERVVIEVDGPGVRMQVENVANLGSETAVRHVFPSLSPFRENAEGKLVSLTHVAELSSYSEKGQKKTFYLPYTRLTIELNDVASRVQWKIIDFGSSQDFEVICDQKGAWTTDHETI